MQEKAFKFKNENKYVQIAAFILACYCIFNLNMKKIKFENKISTKTKTNRFSMQEKVWRVGLGDVRARHAGKLSLSLSFIFKNHHY